MKKCWNLLNLPSSLPSLCLPLSLTLSLWHTSSPLLCVYLEGSRLLNGHEAEDPQTHHSVIVLAFSFIITELWKRKGGGKAQNAGELPVSLVEKVGYWHKSLPLKLQQQSTSSLFFFLRFCKKPCKIEASVHCPFRTCFFFFLN